VELCRKNHLVAHAAQQLADDLLRLAVGVHVGGVDEVDPGIQRGVDDPAALSTVAVAGKTEHHRSKAVGADVDSGLAQ
jgi:hypothetical protein